MKNMFGMKEKRVIELCDLHGEIYKKNTNSDGIIDHGAISETIMSTCKKLPLKEKYFLWFVEGHIHCMLDAKLNKDGVNNLLETADEFIKTINKMKPTSDVSTEPKKTSTVVMDYDVGGISYLNK